MPEQYWPSDSNATQNVCNITNGAEILLMRDSGHNVKVMTASHPVQSFDFSWERMRNLDCVKGARSGLGGAQTLAFVPTPIPPRKARLHHSFDCYPVGDEQDYMKDVSIPIEGSNDESFLKPRRTQKPTSDSLISAASYVPPARTVPSVSMRDMGTETTPIASQEPSLTGTPVRATTSTMGSPVSSCLPSPRRATPVHALICDSEDVFNCDGARKTSEKEIYPKTRRDLQVLGLLRKLNISAWASKQEEDEDAFKSLKSIDLEEVKKNVLKTRAAAWEEAEHAKYMARFKREEEKIKAWEIDKKFKAECEMRRIEVELEKTLSCAHEKLMNKLATARHRAEELRTAAEAKHGEKAAKMALRANRICQTGRAPSSFFGCGFCH